MNLRYDFSIQEISMPSNLTDRYQKYTCSDNNLIKSRGKYGNGFLTLEQGIEKYLDYLEKK